MKRRDDWIEELYLQEYINPKKELDFYWENDKLVMTEQYHIRRGSCCGSKCKHCPYSPPYQKMNKNLNKDQ
jgi:hypothetical protein